MPDTDAPSESTMALPREEDGPWRPLFERQMHSSLRQRAYEDIRMAIFRGGLRPGQRVKERDVAEQMGISTTPVKEALRRLEQDGLVLSQPRRGAVVSPLVLTPAEEILEIRADLEGLAARFAAEKMNDEERRVLREQLDLLLQLEPLKPGDEEALAEASTGFHRMIHVAARNEFILQFLERLAPFDRTIRTASIPSDAGRDSIEHQKICDGIIRRDGLAAEEAMHNHITRGAGLVRTPGT